jgi:hypothetical protein
MRLCRWEQSLWIAVRSVDRKLRKALATLGYGLGADRVQRILARHDTAKGLVHSWRNAAIPARLST